MTAAGFKARCSGAAAAHQASMSTSPVSRHPQGIPAGGQFAASTHSEITVSLTSAEQPITLAPDESEDFTEYADRDVIIENYLRSRYDAGADTNDWEDVRTECGFFQTGSVTGTRIAGEAWNQSKFVPDGRSQRWAPYRPDVAAAHFGPEAVAQWASPTVSKIGAEHRKAGAGTIRAWAYAWSRAETFTCQAS